MKRFSGMGRSNSSLPVTALSPAGAPLPSASSRKRTGITTLRDDSLDAPGSDESPHARTVPAPRRPPASLPPGLLAGGSIRVVRDRLGAAKLADRQGDSRHRAGRGQYSWP